ncbi:hypothetical protein SAMN06298212_1591, partial [Ruaniaceae bacterium KH17]
AVLASYLAHTKELSLDQYLTEHVFAGQELEIIHPEPEDVAGFAAYLERYQAGITIQHAAVQALPNVY